MIIKIKQLYTEQKIICWVVLLIVAFLLLPFVLFGPNSVITIHDNLDSGIPVAKMYRDNSLFFKFDVPTKGFCEISTLYYPAMNFSFGHLLFFIFNDFTAYTLTYCFSILSGLTSMYILLKRIFGLSLIPSVFSSICYAVLPVVFVWNIAVGTLPFIIIFFFYFAFKDNNSFSWKVLLLLFFPLFSNFTSIGIFVLGFWFIGLISLGIKNRKINPNLLIGFVLLCVGYILVDLRLFYVMFILKTPLNRSIFSIYPIDSITQIKTFLHTLKDYGTNGHYHATSFQQKIILPLAFFVSLFCLFKLIRRIKNQSETMVSKIKTALIETDTMIKLLFLLEFIVFVFSCTAALHDSGILNGLIVRYIPLLTGFNWGRIWIFNRVLWYIIFALCLQFILKVNSFTLEINAGNFTEKVKLPHSFFRLIAVILVFLQLRYIVLTPTYYNDQIETWLNEMATKTNISKKITKKIIPNRNYNSSISYKEFFAEDLFKRIKNDINYSDERVAAFGYHPSVLMYNGFNCIDGYNNSYPLSYMQRFRTLIAPELEVNQWAREYYDKWGGRMYLYNSELSYKPTRDKNTSPVVINIDMEVFKDDFEGKYILSRAEISNCDELGLNLVKRYYDEESIYTIFLYRVH